MGSASLLPASDRVAALKRKIDAVEEIQRRFSCTVSVSNEIDARLPYQGLPLGSIHEVKGSNLACSIAFASILSARIVSDSGQIIYAASDRSFHPLALLPYGINPDRWIHVSVRRTQDLAWTVLEALRCPQVSTVLAVLKAADLTLCRRLQLAAEGSGVTGFLLGDAVSVSVASAITRWRISSMNAPSGSSFGEPCWGIELSYCRGGRPGKWTVAWRNGRLESLDSFKGAAKKTVQRVELVQAGTLVG